MALAALALAGTSEFMIRELARSGPVPKVVPRNPEARKLMSEGPAPKVVPKVVPKLDLPKDQVDLPKVAPKVTSRLSVTDRLLCRFPCR